MSSPHVPHIPTVDVFQTQMYSKPCPSTQYMNLVYSPKVSLQFHQMGSCFQYWNIAKVEEKASDQERHNASMMNLMCTGRILCPHYAQEWLSCIQKNAPHHVHVCTETKKNFEKCMRKQITKMMKQMNRDLIVK